MTSKGYKVSLRADENALKLQIMVMAIQFLSILKATELYLLNR